VTHPAKIDVLRLLRCIHDTQANGRKGARVDPPRAAKEIGLEVGSERYHDALGYLAEEGGRAIGRRVHRVAHRGGGGTPAPRLRGIPLHQAGGGSTGGAGRLT
jgi:hypothetical protein